MNNLLAPKPLTAAKVQRWSHQSLLRLAQVELAFRNMVESGRIGPLAAGALAGQLQEAMEHLSSASSAGFGLMLHSEVLPVRESDQSRRRVRVRVTNCGSNSVSRVRLGITSEAPLTIVPSRPVQRARLRAKQTHQAEFVVSFREPLGEAQCRATLAYSASRSYARRSVPFRLEFHQPVTAAD